MKRISLIIIFLIANLNAKVPDFIFTDIDENIIKTNEKIIGEFFSGTNKFLLPQIIKAKQSFAEILYGSYGYLYANVTFAGEDLKKGYFLNYTRKKIESYDVNSKKIYNSALSIDKLGSGFFWLLENNISMDIYLNFQTDIKGLLNNEIYNNQFKNYFIISPNFKYNFSENSKIKGNINYYEIKSKFESAIRYYENRILLLNSVISYEKVFSEINSLAISVFLSQHLVEFTPNRVINNIGEIKLKDKFALSVYDIIDTGLSLNLNKSYKPIVSLDFLYSNRKLKKIIPFLGFQRVYNSQRYKDFIMENYYVKVKNFLPPEINNSFIIGANLLFFDNMIYEIKILYSSFNNGYILKEDEDSLFYIDKLDFSELKILNNIDFKILKFFRVKILYEYLPYINKKVPFKSKNLFNYILDFKNSNINLNFSVFYTDIMEYLNKELEWNWINRYLVFNLSVSYEIYKNYVINFTAENLNIGDFYKIGKYVEPENIYQLGIKIKF